MDELERLSVRPLVLGIIELEEEVRRRRGRLEGSGDVGGDDFGAGKAFGDCDGPVGGGGADVEDAARVAGDGGQG